MCCVWFVGGVCRFVICVVGCCLAFVVECCLLVVVGRLLFVGFMCYKFFLCFVFLVCRFVHVGCCSLLRARWRFFLNKKGVVFGVCSLVRAVCVLFVVWIALLLLRGVLVVVCWLLFDVSGWLCVVACWSCVGVRWVSLCFMYLRVVVFRV